MLLQRIYTYYILTSVVPQAGCFLYGCAQMLNNDRFAGGSRFILGLDGILGMEYTIQDESIPLNFSLDWKPTFDLAPFAQFWGSELALSVRYVF